MKWNNDTLRFPTEDAFHAMLTPDSKLAVFFDLDEPYPSEGFSERTSSSGTSSFHGKKVIACAAAVPWKGGWRKEHAATETGWEMKAVCVDGNEQYLRKGLAVQLLESLERALITNAREVLRRGGVVEGKRELDLWILAAECINGKYWRKKGYVELRRCKEGAGVWSCRTEFEIVVLRKVVEFDVSARESSGASKQELEA